MIHLDTTYTQTFPQHVQQAKPVHQVPRHKIGACSEGTTTRGPISYFFHWIIQSVKGFLLYWRSQAYFRALDEKGVKGITPIQMRWLTAGQIGAMISSDGKRAISKEQLAELKLKTIKKIEGTHLASLAPKLSPKVQVEIFKQYKYESSYGSVGVLKKFFKEIDEAGQMYPFYCAIDSAYNRSKVVDKLTPKQAADFFAKAPNISEDPIKPNKFEIFQKIEYACELTEVFQALSSEEDMGDFIKYVFVSYKREELLDTLSGAEKINVFLKLNGNKADIFKNFSREEQLAVLKKAPVSAFNELALETFYSAFDPEEKFYQLIEDAGLSSEKKEKVYLSLLNSLTSFYKVMRVIDLKTLSAVYPQMTPEQQMKLLGTNSWYSRKELSGFIKKEVLNKKGVWENLGWDKKLALFREFDAAGKKAVLSYSNKSTINYFFQQMSFREKGELMTLLSYPQQYEIFLLIRTQYQYSATWGMAHLDGVRLYNLYFWIKTNKGQFDGDTFITSLKSDQTLSEIWEAYQPAARAKGVSEADQRAFKKKLQSNMSHTGRRYYFPEDFPSSSGTGGGGSSTGNGGYSGASSSTGGGSDWSWENFRKAWEDGFGSGFFGSTPKPKPAPKPRAAPNPRFVPRSVPTGETPESLNRNSPKQLIEFFGKKLKGEINKDEYLTEQEIGYLSNTIPQLPAAKIQSAFEYFLGLDAHSQKEQVFSFGVTFVAFLSDQQITNLFNARPEFFDRDKRIRFKQTPHTKVISMARDVFNVRARFLRPGYLDTKKRPQTEDFKSSSLKASSKKLSAYFHEDRINFTDGGRPKFEHLYRAVYDILTATPNDDNLRADG